MPDKTALGKASDEIFMLRKTVRIILWFLFAYIMISAIMELLKFAR
jgi:hypothetical protein